MANLVALVFVFGFGIFLGSSLRKSESPKNLELSDRALRDLRNFGGKKKP